MSSVGSNSPSFEGEDAFTIPVTGNDSNEQFADDLLNNVVAENVVMDEIVGHMATPMGPDDDDDSLSIEMMEPEQENEGFITIVGDAEIDEIDNEIGDVAHDINEMLTPESMDEDVDIVKDVDDMIQRTPLIVDDDGDIDDIVDDDVSIIGDVNNMMHTPLDDVDVIDDILEQEVITPMENYDDVSDQFQTIK